MVNGGNFNHTLGQMIMHRTQEGHKTPLKMCVVAQVYPQEGPMSGVKFYRVSYIYEGNVHEAMLPEQAVMAYRELH